MPYLQEWKSFALHTLRTFPRFLFRFAAGISIAIISCFILFLFATAIRGAFLPEASTFSAKDMDTLESSLESRLKKEDYGIIEHAMWSNLFSQSFYAYGRANRYDRYPTQSGKLELIAELERIYDWIDGSQKEVFKAVGATNIENGIIYQGHRLHVLGLLAKYRQDPETLSLFAKEVEKVAEVLRESPRFTAESYPWWAWWVDNVDAYYSLFLADNLSGKQNYAPLIHDWTSEIRKSQDTSGNILAEVYGPYVAENQARSGASAWLLVYLKDLDPELYAEIEPNFHTAFELSFGSYLFEYEVPRGQDLINQVPTGPVIFGVSSAGTLLSLPLYQSARNSDKLLHAIESAFWYNRENGKILGGVATLLESALYWGLSFGDL